MPDPPPPKKHFCPPPPPRPPFGAPMYSKQSSDCTAFVPGVDIIVTELFWWGWGGGGGVFELAMTK